MGIAIEISFKVCGKESWEDYLEERKVDAESFDCSMQYYMNEIEGIRHRINRNECVQVVLFEAEKEDNLISYIKYLRMNKENYIECVYSDDGQCEILFASPKYIKKMDKNDARAFKKQIKNREERSELELKIIELMRTSK
jgi:hypothetical protein